MAEIISIQLICDSTMTRRLAHMGMQSLTLRAWEPRPLYGNGMRLV